MYTSEDFNEIVGIFRKHVPNMFALYLFGSYARGAASDDSDVDIAVIMDKKPDWQECNGLLNALWKDLGSRRYIVDIIIKEASEFEKDKDLAVTFSHTIATEGKVLWTKAA